MLDKLDELVAQRTALHQQLAVVNEAIRQEFAKADEQLATLRRSLSDDAPKKSRRPGSGAWQRTPEARAEMSRIMRERWARMKTNGAEQPSA